MGHLPHAVRKMHRPIVFGFGYTAPILLLLIPAVPSHGNCPVHTSCIHVPFLALPPLGYNVVAGSSCHLDDVLMLIIVIF